MKSAAVTRAGHIETRIGPPSGHHATPPPAPSRARVARSSQPLHGASMPHMGRKAAPRLADLRIRHPAHPARGLPGPPHPPRPPPRGPAGLHPRGPGSHLIPPHARLPTQIRFADRFAPCAPGPAIALPPPGPKRTAPGAWLMPGKFFGREQALFAENKATCAPRITVVYSRAGWGTCPGRVEAVPAQQQVVQRLQGGPAFRGGLAVPLRPGLLQHAKACRWVTTWCPEHGPPREGGPPARGFLISTSACNALHPPLQQRPVDRVRPGGLWPGQRTPAA
jgi:hypothetical protein